MPIQPDSLASVLLKTIAQQPRVSAFALYKKTQGCGRQHDFGATMWVLLGNGLATVIPSDKSTQRLLTITPAGKKELAGFGIRRAKKQANAIAKRAKVAQQQKTLARRDARWVREHRRVNWLQQYKKLGFHAQETQIIDVSTLPSECEDGARCTRPNCNENWVKNQTLFGKLVTLTDGTVEVKIFEHVCGHQYKLGEE